MAELYLASPISKLPLILIWHQLSNPFCHRNCFSCFCILFSHDNIGEVSSPVFPLVFRTVSVFLSLSLCVSICVHACMGVYTFEYFGCFIILSLSFVLSKFIRTGLGTVFFQLSFWNIFKIHITAAKSFHEFWKVCSQYVLKFCWVYISVIPPGLH